MTRKLLIIDDSEHDRLSYCRALRNTGWEIVTADNLSDGRRALQESPPDLILLDYNLPDGFGIELLQEINVDDNAPPVIMLTGSEDASMAVKVMKGGARDYFVKNVSGSHLELLPLAMDRVLEQHALKIEKSQAELQLRLAANVYNNITEGVLVTDPDGTIVSLNPAFCAITGYSEEELVGGNPRIIKSNRHDHAFYQTMWDRISSEGYWHSEIWNRRKDGEPFLARLTITAIRDNQGNLQHYVAVQTDITAAKQNEEIIRHQAYHDALTGLPNRALFMDRLRLQLAYAQRHDTSLAVLFIDLDGFKTINDDLGHEVGDDLLKDVAQRLKCCVRESDTVARLGGDEFTAILNDLQEPESAAFIAQKILDTLQSPFLLGRHERYISASIGVALYPADSNDVIDLLRLADSAMYKSKLAGKARFTFARQELGSVKNDSDRHQAT
jgi:diguanylate cyclase (GGDEF)-like protein/PAS domain S-box-containing protein